MSSAYEKYIGSNYGSAENVVDGLTQESAPSSVVIINEDYELNKELERRLELAHLYRLILNESLFDGDDSDCKRIVESEIRGFIRSRLEYLMGIRQEQTIQQPLELPFDKEELSILKALVKAAKKKPEITNTVVKPEPKLPTLKKVSNVEPKPQTLVKKPTTLKKTPVEAPQKKQPVQQRPKAQQQVTQPVYKDGDVIEKDGVQFRIKEVNGVLLEVPMPKPKAMSPNAKPMPSPMQMSTLASMEADRRMGSGGVLAQLINNEIKKGE